MSGWLSSADGRYLGDEPELTRVLNEPQEVRFAQIDPIFAGEVSPEPVVDALPNPIEEVLFKTVDGSGNTSDLTVAIAYTEQYATTDPTRRAP